MRKFNENLKNSLIFWEKSAKNIWKFLISSQNNFEIFWKRSKKIWNNVKKIWQNLFKNWENFKTIWDNFAKILENFQ